MRTTLPLLALLALPAAAFAQANAVVPDPDPEIERKSFCAESNVFSIERRAAVEAALTAKRTQAEEHMSVWQAEHVLTASRRRRSALRT